jgi:hypothetical protein
MVPLLETLRFLPAALLAALLTKATLSGRIGLNQHVFARRRQPIGFWLTFALAFAMLCFTLAGALTYRLARG